MFTKTHILAAGLVLAAAFGTTARAQTESAANLTGQVMALSIAVQVCSIDVTPAQTAGLNAAGEKMQKKAGLSDADLLAAAPDVTKTVTAACNDIKPNFTALYNDIVAKVAQVN